MNKEYRLSLQGVSSGSTVRFLLNVFTLNFTLKLVNTDTSNLTFAEKFTSCVYSSSGRIMRQVALGPGWANLANAGSTGFVLITIVQISNLNVQKVTLDRLTLYLMVHILSDWTNVLATTSLYDAEEAHYGNDSDNDYETEDEVSVLLIDWADSLLDDNLLHLCHDLAGFIHSHYCLGAICLCHDLGCRWASGFSSLNSSVFVVLRFLFNNILLEYIPVKLIVLFLLVRSKNWDALDLSTEDPRIHELIFLYNEISIGLIDFL